MTILKKLTLVILSYERKEYLMRLLKYYFLSDVNILILDGSKKCNSSFLQKFFNESTRYFHMPVSYKDRISFALKKAASASTNSRTLRLCRYSFNSTFRTT